MSAPSVLVAARRCLALLDARDRRRWALLIPWLLAAAALEAWGASLIFTLVQGVDDPRALSVLPLSRALLAVLPSPSPERSLYAFAAAVALFYVVKNAVIFFTGWRTAERAATSVSRVSARLLRGYLSMPYAFHLERGAVALVRNVGTSVDQAYRGALVSLVSGASEALLALALLLVLLFTSPGLTIALGVLLGAFFVAMLRLTRDVFERWGAELHALNASSHGCLQQSLEGVKEVKLLGREGYFHDAFERLRARMSRLFWLRTALEQLPRLVLETLFVLGVSAVVVLFFASGERARVVPLLGLFAYAGFRLMPLLQRLVYHVNAVRFAAPAIEELWRDWTTIATALAASDAPEPPPLPFTRELRVEGVTHVHPGSARPALLGVELSIRPGESIGIVGPTGAGKSTLLELLLGLLDPTHGRITVDGVPLEGALRAWQRQLGFVPQAIHLIDDTLRRNIALGLEDGAIDEVRVEEAARLAQLEPLIRSLPRGLDTVVGERGMRLSGGERQRVAVARALYRDPAVLALDEATAALDLETEEALARAVEGLRGEKTLLVVAHRLSTVRRCDRLVLLDRGEVVAVGAFEELRASCPRFRELIAAASGPTELRA
jgi:ABC-type multidrug transport system fused ATPase/permease subunit